MKFSFILLKNVSGTKYFYRFFIILLFPGIYFFYFYFFTFERRKYCDSRKIDFSPFSVSGRFMTPGSRKKWFWADVRPCTRFSGFSKTAPTIFLKFCRRVLETLLLKKKAEGGFPGKIRFWPEMAKLWPKLKNFGFYL